MQGGTTSYNCTFKESTNCVLESEGRGRPRAATAGIFDAEGSDDVIYGMVCCDVIVLRNVQELFFRRAINQELPEPEPRCIPCIVYNM